MIPPGVGAARSSAAAVVCVVLLLALLAQKELVRAYTHNRSTARYLNVAVVPLGAVALTVFLARLASFLR